MFGNLAFMQGYLVYLHKQAIIQAKYTRKHVFKFPPTHPSFTGLDDTANPGRITLK